MHETLLKYRSRAANRERKNNTIRKDNSSALSFHFNKKDRVSRRNKKQRRELRVAKLRHRDALIPRALKFGRGSLFSLYPFLLHEKEPYFQGFPLYFFMKNTPWKIGRER